MNTHKYTHNNLTRLLRGAVLAAAMFFSYAGAQAQSHVIVGGSVYGGGNLADVAGNTSVLLDQAGAVVTNDVYGGGALANVGTDNSNTTTVTLLQGTVSGDVYGGGLGRVAVADDPATLDVDESVSAVAALVNGVVTVNIGSTTGSAPDTTVSGNATIGGSVYGCNNLNGTPKDNVFVNIYATAHNGTNDYPDPEPSLADLATQAASSAFAIKAVYGGGNQAAYAPTGSQTALVHVYTCANTIKTVYGGGNAADATQVALTIDGGRFDRVFGGGNGYSETGNHNDPTAANYNPGANVTTSATTVIHGGLYRQVFGGSNQYGDVANASLTIDETSGCTELIYEAFGGANEAPITGNLTTTLACGASSGEIGNFYGGSNLADITGNVTLNVIGGSYTSVFGGSKGRLGNTSADSANISGTVTLNLHGGTMTNAFGGSNVNGNVTGKITVNVEDTSTSCPLTVHNVYGGGRDAAYTPTTPGSYPEVNIISGTVSTYVESEVTKGGHVFGGGLGRTATVTSNPVVNLQGGTAQSAVFGGGEAAPVGGNPTVNALYGTAPLVYGGGLGSSAVVTGDPAVVVNETPSKTLTVASVYGGGDEAPVSGNTTVTLTAGTLTNAFGGGNVADITGTTSVTIQGVTVANVYGGGNQASVSSTSTVTLTSGNVTGGLYGGCNTSGNVAEAVVTLTGGIVGTAFVEDDPDDPDDAYVPPVTANVFGGGLGQDTKVLGDVTVTIGDGSTGPTVYGDVYGGSAKGLVNCNEGGTARNGEAKTDVTLNKGTIYGDLYGGGLGDAEHSANVWGPVTVTVNDGSVATYQDGLYVAGGRVLGCNNLNGAPQVSVLVDIEGGNIARDVYGGGNLADASIPTHVEVEDGDIARDVYGGGAYANTGATLVDILGGTVEGDVYGGCLGGEVNDVIYSPAVNGNATVNIGSGTVDPSTGFSTSTTGSVTFGGGSSVYGGNNAFGSPTGVSTVNVYQTAHTDGTGETEDNTVAGDYYAIGNVFGGGNAAAFTGTASYVNIYGCDNTIQSVVGGGNQAATKALNTMIQGGRIGSVFGGGNGYLDAYDPSDNIPADVNGDITLNIHGGIINQVFSAGNEIGAISGTITTNIDKPSGGCDMKIGEVYGGGNLAASKAASITIGCTGAWTISHDSHNSTTNRIGYELEGIGTLYGGANQADILGNNIALTINSGIIDNVYGGNNQSGSISGTITVNINKNNSATCASDWYVGNVYGGGNVAAYSGSPVVTVTNGEVSHNVYGGGNEAGVGGSTVNINGGGVAGGVYGGCNTSGTVTGAIAVNLTGGTVGVDGTTTDVVYGGGLGAATRTSGNVTVTLGDAAGTSNPVVYGALYGGSALGQVNDAEADLTTVNILSGTLHGNVYGGGLGEAGVGNVAKGQVNGTITVNIGANTGTNESPNYVGYATIDGDVYGCNNTNGSPQGNVTVNIYKTAHTEGVNTTADAGYAIDEVFGGGRNASFTATGKTAMVNVFTCDNTIRRVFGGGDAAAVTGSSVTVNGGRIDYLFGGGNGESVAANIGTGGITIALHGGIINHVINASNENGTIGGAITVTVDNESGCSEVVDEFFGGSNMVDITGNVNTTIECGAGTFGAVYGGSNKADIDGNVSLTIQGGTIGRVFGGSKGDLSSLGGGHSDVSANITGNVTLTLNGGSIGAAFGGSNINGTIGGTITVNVNDLGVEGCELEIDSVFGAGNLTAYNPTTPGSYPAVNIINGTVNDVVFGGGKQAAVTSNPVVTIGDGIVGHNAAVTGNVYGGGDEAGITGSTHVILNSGTVGNGIYGGCNTSGTVTVNSVVDLLGGQVGALGDTATICGGGYGQLTKVDGDVHVTFGNAAGTATPMAYARMYGGSALGSVNTSPSNVGTTGYLNQVNNVNTTTIDILSGTFNGDIFGGGLGQKNGYNGATSDIAALVHGKIHVNIGATDGEENPTYSGSAVLRNASIYGCNNLNGSPQNDVYIDIYKTAHNATDLHTVTQGATFAIANVYGGGNRADYEPTATLRKDTTGINNDSIAQNHFRKPHIYVHGCENTIEELFAGGNAAAVMGDSLVFDGGRFGDVFGGGNGALIAANVGRGGVYLVGKGGRVGYIYEHCNKRGSIAGKVTFVNGSGVSTDCNEGVLKVENHFCGGNEVDVAGDFVHEFTCRQNLEYTALYGGCRLGTTYGNITLIITGGSFGTIYGGPKGDRDVSAWVRKYPTLAELQRDSTGYDEGTGKYASLKDEENLIYSKDVHKYMKEHPEKRGNGGGNVTIILKGGTIGDVYGGCDYNGNVEGRITIIVDSTNTTLNPSLDSCALEVNNIYGAGNRAVYTPDTAATNSNYLYPYISLENGHVNQNVFGGGKGNDGSVNYGSVTSNPKIVMNPDVANSKNFLIKGNLYGGGELGQVNGSTSIDIDAGTVKGTVYGGGKGHTSHESFGLVTKNTLVDISGGTVERSVYGGGSLGSVGTFTETWPSNGTTNGVFHKAGEPKTCATNTGLCKVLLSGTAQVGVTSKAHMPSTLLPGDDEYGYVFAASQGIADSVLYPKANLLGVACTTYLEISGSALVTASAYGGSENGEVLSSTYVKVMGGQIGVGGQLVEGVFTPDPVYTSEQWTAAINAVKNGTIGTSYVNPFHECDHWPHGNAGNFYPYDIFADEEGYDSHGGSTTASDGHTFFGNVFGGGSGYYPFATGKWRRSAGRVLGHTKVEVTGGHILTSIYGGNETTDVLGDSCVVIFSGGTLGVPRTVSQMQDHPVTCYLFGAGKGDERVMFNRWTNVQNTRVTVSGGHIFGSVFGGGEDGHVMRNTKVDILGDAYIGTTGTSYVDGNVFGGGRGFSGNALTAGNVGGDVDVNIYGSARLLGSVYGGGRLASVGYGLYLEGNANYGIMRDDNVDDDGNSVANFPRGHITVDIYGDAVIGNDDATDYGLSHSRGGNVYGGSMGRLAKLDGTLALPIWHRLGNAKATTVTVRGDSWVKGNVYGGSELGRITGDVEVNIQGNATVGRKAAGSTSHGNVYGGGVGRGELTSAEKAEVDNDATSDSIPTFAGLVGGNIEVNISGGIINNNVYGGGELGSVGTITSVTKHTNLATTYALSWPYEYTYSGSSGDAVVNITGGTIGYISGSDTSGGDIYGSARGTVGDRYVTGRLATARATHVNINLASASDKIVGTVYGSGENGHVYDSAVVTLRNGLVLGSVFGGGKGTDTYTDQLKDPSDDHLYNATVYDIIAGKVFGNTKVNILGGRVAKNVYGGGNLASVGKGNYKGYGEGSNVSSADSLLAENSGHCYVTILGGVIGPDSITAGTVYNHSYSVPDGNVYGAGKGIVYPEAARVGFDYDRNYYLAYVNKTFVIIGDSTNRSCDYKTVLTPHVTANVFGGGENGHVRFDTYVQTNRGIVGVRPLATGVKSDDGHWANRGNVWGAGRGEDKNGDGTYCQSAGSVTRNTTIDILGARIYRNVQGGGAMASVGAIKGRTGDSSTCVINVRLPLDSDTIGGGTNTNNAFGGYIGGGSRGIPSPNGTDSSALATCHNSQINFYRGRLKNTIYGGGENGQMLGNTEINVYGGYIRSAIYGGGKGSWKAPVSETGDATGDYTNDTISGYIAGNTTVNLLGGQVPFTYGGCRRANVGGTATINIGKDNGDGTYSGDASFIVGKDKVYGGNQYAGSPRGNIYVNVYKTAHTTTDAATYTEDDGEHGAPTYAINYVYGGSYNSPYLPTDSGHYAQVHIYGCENTIDTVYGGCAAADAGAKPGIGASTKLIIDGGRFNAVFGGGDGTFDRYLGTSVPANIYGAAITEIHGGTFGSLYGGSNYNGNVDTIRISVESDGPCGGTIEGDEFFGGSNVTDLGPIELSATLGCGVVFNTAYGGSNMADITGNVTFNIQGGTLGKVFGGSKGRQAQAAVLWAEGDELPDGVSVGDVRTAAVAAVEANIAGNVVVNATGGTLGYVYGGSNLNGNITGTITVNIDSIQSECPLTIENNVYGGSYVTMYNPTGIADRDNTRSPVVNIKHGTIHGNVFGGGHGQGSHSISNPTVYIGNGNYTTSIDDPRTTAVEEDNIIARQPVVMGNVYGGGDQSRVFGNTRVDMLLGTVEGNIFGACKGIRPHERPDLDEIPTRGIVDGWTTVNMSGGTVHGNLYGGGEIGSVDHFTGTNSGTWSRYSSQSAENQAKYGNTYVNVTGGTVGYATAITTSDDSLSFVYGGGKGQDSAAYKTYANVKNTYVTVSGGLVSGSVFGGAEDGHVLGNTNVTISNTVADSAYHAAHNDVAVGTVLTTPVIGSGGFTHEFDGCVLGGGLNINNLHRGAGRVQGNTYVTVTGGRIRRSVFGGGAQARVGVDTDGLLADQALLYANDVYDSLNHGSTFVDVSGDTLQYASAAAFAASDYYATYQTTTRTYGDGKVTLYLTTIGGPDNATLVDNDYTIGDIFGGGKGDTKDTSDIFAGRVMNTHVKVHGSPRIMADIYAGGEMSCIGWYDTGTNATAVHPRDAYYDNTGYTKVNIKDSPYVGSPYEFSSECIHGGRPWTLIDAHGRLYHTCSGNVYGGGQGYVEVNATHRHNWVQMGRVRKTQVTIDGGRFLGNVFGGGSRGFVKEDCYVTVTGGHFGCVINDPSNDLGDKRYYYGSIFGGGYGNHKTFLHKNDSCFVKSNGDTVMMMPIEMAGRVYGNTYVNVSGGTIMHSIYGGGDMASTGWVERDPTTGNYYYDTPAKRHGGVCTVNITGTTIVGPLDYTGHNAYVYGAGKGIPSDPTDQFKHCANVNETHLTINLGPTGRIWGSSFGGGADAHVLGDVETQYHGGTMGTRGITSYDGNIFGAGRNYLNTNHTNGRVQGNIKILMDGGAIKGTIFGGGRLALSGVDSVGHFIDANHGNVNVWVSGNAVVGTDHADSLLYADESCGDIFGSGKGDIADYADIWAGRVTNATITVKDTTISGVTTSPTIHGGVFGGGEMASLGWWDDTIKDGSTVIFHTKDDVPGSYSTDYGTFYTGTGSATINILSGTIGTAAELTYTKEDNPGNWTMYNDDGLIFHTATGNVYGGCQGDVDPSAPRWVSMGRSNSSTVTIGEAGGTTYPIIRGCVFGGSEQGIVTGDTRVTVYSGTIGTSTSVGSTEAYDYGDVYAAGYGSDDPADNAVPYVYEDENGDEQTILNPTNDSTSARTALSLSSNPLALAGRVFGDSRVDVLGGHILGSVYGGGSFASVGDDKSSSDGATAETYPVNGNTTINIGTGTVNPSTGFAESVSGNATIDGDIFGANNYSGSPYGNTEVNIYRTAHTAGDALVIGTGDDAVTVVIGNQYPFGLKELEEPTDELTEEDIASTKLSGQRGNLSKDSRYALHAVYGGGNLAAHTPIDDVNGTTLVHVYKCEENTIKYVYGGGNAAATQNNHVIVDGGRVKNLFGGGDGYSSTGNHDDPDGEDYNPGADVLGTATTEIHGGIFDSVYAGSNQKGYVNNIDLVMDNASGCEELIANSFGGGNEAEGGGGEITLVCGVRFNNFYAGANNADIGSEADWNANPRVQHNIILNIEGGIYENVFGGNNKGGVIYGDVTVNIHGGQIQNLYGGNNAGGNIMGSIEVNVDFDPDYTCADGLRLDNVYGGGRNAVYSPYDPFHASPVINVKNNRVKLPSDPTTAFTDYTTEAPSSVVGHDSAFVKIYDVFGGGLGATARVTAYPRIIVGGFAPETEITTPDDPETPEDETVTTTLYTRKARVYHNLYGGGSAAPVDGNTTVYVCDATIGTTTNHDYPDGGMVFGGGYGATSTVQGNTVVGVYGLSEIMNNVYGGGNAGIVTGRTHTEVAFKKQVFPPEVQAYPDIRDGVVHVMANFLIHGMETLEDKEFYYTSDGITKPDITNPAHKWDGNPIELTYGNTIRCIATIPGYIPSAITAPMMPSPDIIIDEENHKVSFNSTIGSRIRYTLDGTDPVSAVAANEGSTVYCVVGETTGTPVDLPSNAVVKAIAEGQGCETSPVTYLTAERPTITIDGSTVTITAPHATDHIVYTTDGSTPVSGMVGTLHGTHVESNTVILEDVASGTTIKAITEHRGYMPSQINAVIYQP